MVVGGTADHALSLFVLSKDHSIAQIVYEVKRSSSKWNKTQGPEYKKFYRQIGYGAFSVRQSHVEQVRQYIRGQERHHRKMTFQDELPEFFKRYEVGELEKGARPAILRFLVSHPWVCKRWMTIYYDIL